MEQITMDFENAFACSEMDKSKLLEAIMDVKNGNVKNFDTLEDMMAYLDN